MSAHKLAYKGFVFYIYFIILNLSNLLPLLFNLSTNVSRIVTYLPILVLFSGLLFVSKSRGAKTTKINLWIISFIAYLALGFIASLIFNENFEYFTLTVPYYSRILLEVFFFYFFLLSLNKEQFLTVLKHITFAYIILAISIPVMAILGISLYESVTGLESVIASGRPAGLAANANPAAFQSILGAILIIYWLMSGVNKIPQITLTILLIIQIGCTIFTFSNTGMICLVVVAFVAITKLYRSGTGVYKFLGLVFVLLFISFQVLDISIADQLDKNNLKKIENFTKIISMDNNVEFSNRDSKFKNGINEFKKSPLIGSGLGYFKHKLSVHNTYLTILGESGIIPFLLFLFVLAFMFKNGLLIKARNVSFLQISSVLVYSLFCITLQNMTDLFQYHLFFMMLLSNRNFFINPFSN